MSEPVGLLYYEVDFDTRKLISGQREIDKRVDAAALTFNRITQAVKLYAAALALLKQINIAEDFRLLSVRAEVAAGSIGAGARAMRELEKISTRTQTGLAENVSVFTRLNQSILQLGGTQQDTLRVNELLGKAIRVSGASATEARSALLQFGQALGSGKLAGDELRSLMENAPYLMQRLAEGLAVPIGALKQLGEDGKLTSDVVVDALSKAAEKIEADFQKLPRTFSGAMTALSDSAGRVAEKLDVITGTSALAAGAATGLSRVLDMLAQQFADAATQGDKLGGNRAVETWADKTQLALTYLADAVDVVWQTLSVLGRNVYFVFETLGSQIGGVNAMLAAAARGQFAQAREIWRQMNADDQARRAELDQRDAGTLRKRLLAGQRMRQEMEQRRVEDRGFTPASPGSKLRPPARTGDKDKFDAVAYLLSLQEKTADAYERINVIEQQALHKAGELRKIGKLDAQQYEEARSLIAMAAAHDRAELVEREEREKAELIKRGMKEVEEAEKAAAEQRRRAIEYGAQLTKAVNPVDALRQEYEAKLNLVTQYEQLMAAVGVQATEQAQVARTQITREYELQRLALAEQSFRSQSDANTFLINSINALSTSATGAIVGLINGTTSASDVMRSLGNVILNEAVGSLVQVGVQMLKNAVLGDTLAAADKARSAANAAVYAASVSAQVAGMSALAAQNAFAATAAIPIVGPELAPAAAAAAAALAGALGAPAIATAPLAGARRYGGPVSAGSLYRVNEAGRPEMFVASNGAQFMMPTANGHVTPADQLAGGAPAVNVVFNTTVPLRETARSYDERSRTVTIAVAEVARQISDMDGTVWSALRGSTNVQGRF